MGLSGSLDHAVRKGGGKQKGASFEREVCVLLSKWVTNGVREDVFWRSAMSGGRATVGHKRGKQHSTQVGDISCIHPSGHRFCEAFAPECKFYANLDYQGLLTGKGKLLAFWTEIRLQAKRYNKHPFLVARQNRLAANVCLNMDGVRELGLLPRKALLVSPPNGMYIYDFKDFLMVCKPYVDPNWRPASNRQRTRSIPLRDI
jgi:hypothetical protein